MKNIGKIYIIINLTNKKQYIGQTIQTLKKRFNEHKCNAFTRNKKGKLYSSMRKYGADNFEIQLLEDNIPLELINEKEEHYIKFFNSVNCGYNAKYREDGIRTIKDFDINKIVYLYKNGKTLKQIATIYKSDKRTISSILRENAIEIRDWNKEQSVNLTKETLYDLYVEKNLTSYEIGEIVGLSSTAILKWLRKFNIEVRLPHNYKELKCHS